MRRTELLFRGGVVLFFLFLLPEAYRLGGTRRFGEVGSGLWPILILTLGVLLAFGQFLEGFRRYRGKDRPVSLPVGKATRAVIASGIVLAYLILIPWTGFFVATPAFVAAFMYGLGERRGILLLIAPLLVTVGIFMAFVKFIFIPLPRGVGLFLTFSRMLY